TRSHPPRSRRSCRTRASGDVMTRRHGPSAYTTRTPFPDDLEGIHSVATAFHDTPQAHVTAVTSHAGSDGPMHTGGACPPPEIGADRGAIRAYAVGVEELGYHHIMAYDHVLGADPAAHPGWSKPYKHTDTFLEPFTLFGFLAGICTLELMTGVIVLPQRQTALVAKQAAEIDILTDGRFRLGVGVGWNHVEYEALGTDFTNRGRRVEEQVDLMRQLWTTPSLTYRGEYHQVTGA